MQSFGEGGSKHKLPVIKGHPGLTNKVAGIQSQIASERDVRTSVPTLNQPVSRPLNTPSVTTKATGTPKVVTNKPTTVPAPTLQGYQAPVSQPYSGGSIKV